MGAQQPQISPGRRVEDREPTAIQERTKVCDAVLIAQVERVQRRSRQRSEIGQARAVEREFRQRYS